MSYKEKYLKLKKKYIQIKKIQLIGSSMEFKNNGPIFSLLTSEQKNNPEIFLTANLRIYDYALQYASDELKKDYNFILKAVKQSVRALEYASNTLKDNRIFILDAIKINGLALKYANISFKKDRDIILAAITQNGLALEFADIYLQQDKEIVLAAIKKNAFALKFANISFADKARLYSCILDILPLVKSPPFPVRLLLPI